MGTNLFLHVYEASQKQR